MGGQRHVRVTRCDEHGAMSQTITPTSTAAPSLTLFRELDSLHNTLATALNPCAQGISSTVRARDIRTRIVPVLKQTSGGRLHDLGQLTSFDGANRAANRVRGAVNDALAGDPDARASGIHDWKQLLTRKELRILQSYAGATSSVRRAQPPGVAALTPLGRLMERDAQPSARQAARVYARESLGLKDSQILDIQPSGLPDPASTVSWMAQRIIYTNGHLPNAKQVSKLKEIGQQIGRLEALNGADAAIVVLALTGSVAALRGAGLAEYRATFDVGTKRMYAQQAAELSRVGAGVTVSGTVINGVRVAATDNLGKLVKAMSEYNDLFKEAYGIRSVVVR